MYARRDRIARLKNKELVGVEPPGEVGPKHKNKGLGGVEPPGDSKRGKSAKINSSNGES